MINDTPTLQLAVWDDPLAANGLQTDTDDALIYLAALLGPTSTLALHRLARCLTTGTGRIWSIEDLAATFGVGASQMRASLARLERFGMIRTVGERTEVRTRVPALAARHVERMPAYLAATVSLSGRPRRPARGMTAPSASQVTVCASPKGGQGCTTIAAILAVLAARSNQPTLLLDTRGDAAPTLGFSDPAPARTFADAIAHAVEPCDRLRVASVAGDRIDADAITAISELVAAGHRVLVDTGTDHDVLHRFDPLRPQRLLVTRPCYLALRRAIGVPFVPDHVVLISEHQRCLTERDVSLALALPVTSVPYDPAIARAIDAGLLAARLPRSLANAIAQLPV